MKNISRNSENCITANKLEMYPEAKSLGTFLKTSINLLDCLQLFLHLEALNYLENLWASKELSQA